MKAILRSVLRTLSALAEVVLTVAHVLGRALREIHDDMVFEAYARKRHT